ncbi:MAG: DNA polymerase III subunit gamma/tau [Candidatus Gastranaerophilaceae bacterium]
MSENYIPQYVPLYRKYRPKNLQEVVGQEHIKKALANAINLNKISHAYLFTGPRGTGKTSVARILAKSLNCTQGPTLTPCEVCPSCTDIKNSTPMDVIEIDAASNRKVEDAQNILEKIQYVPVNGKYKIYIIDEVHMLTNHAFNALLKTLEEPPENVIFILATTEPQKVLETITSRCQRFDFRRITTDDIINHLKNIAKLEKIKIDNDALFTIAKNAAGGMRDSLALLDQVSVLDNSKTITTDDVNKLLGRLSFDMLNSLSESIIESKPQDAIELLEKIYNSGNEPVQILINLMGYFKNLLIVKNCQGGELLVDLTQLNTSQIQILKKQSENIDTHQITFLIEKIIYYIKELKTTTNQHLWLEVAIIDLANLAQNTSLLALQERVSKLESGTIQTATPKIYAEKPAPPAKEEPPVEISKEVVESPKKIAKEEAPKEKQQEPEKKPAEEDLQLGDLWIELLKNVSSPPTVSLLSEHTRPIELSEKKVIIGCEKEFAFKMLNGDAKKKAINEAAQKLFNKDVSVVIRLASSDEMTVEKKNPIIEKPVKKAEEVPEETSEEPSDEDEFIEHELAKNSKQNEKFMPSDQVSMVMTLFDGKYIE